MNTISRWIVGMFFVLALVGFADAAYLTAEHYRGVVPPCSLVSGCETVLTSRYAVVAGVPISVVGMAYYALVLVLLVAYVDSSNPRMMHWAARLTIIGFLASLYLLYVQAFILEAFCLYCLVSAATSTLLFVLGVYIMYTQKYGTK